MNAAPRLPWGWLEAFVGILHLSNGLLLLPGTQSLRFGIRGLPYAASLLSLIFLYKRRRAAFPPGAMWMALTIPLLILNLLHPATQSKAGVAQVIFEVAIISPVFWAAGQMSNQRRLTRLLWIVFGTSAIGAIVGLLQIYNPDQFLPAEFSLKANSHWLDSMTFISPNGTVLVRPPGLSDLPGGAAVSGALTAVLGLAFSAARRCSLWLRAVCLAASAAGISVLFLTQVRSLTIMTIAAIAVIGLFSIKQERTWNRGWLAGAAAVVILGAFTYAVALGGDTVRDRFLGLTHDGLVKSYQTNRGLFWEYTFNDALFEYPFGAGLGRWGMMNVYFAEPRPDSVPLYAEIQLTGWLYDGGVPMWMLFGGGICASMLFLYRIATATRYGSRVPFAAALIFCINLMVIGAAVSGPAFNTALGIEYWLLLGCLYGAAKSAWKGPNLHQIRLRFRRRPVSALAAAS